MVTRALWVLYSSLTFGDGVALHADKTECAHAAAYMREVNIQAGIYISVSCHEIHVPAVPAPADAPIPEMPAIAP